jgi:hypothetical protein
VSAQAAVPTCRNGHPRVNADGSSNVYTYPSREGRKPRITCRICRDGLPRAADPRSQRDPTMWDEFELKPVRSRKDERRDYAYLRRFGLIEAWTHGLEIDMEAISEDFFVAMNRRYPARLRRAYRLIIEGARAESERLDAQTQRNLNEVDA